MSDLLLFYVTFTWRRKSMGMFDTLTDVVSWKIRRTPHDLDSAAGLQAFIQEMEPEYPNMCITFWKRLT